MRTNQRSIEANLRWFNGVSNRSYLLQPTTTPTTTQPLAPSEDTNSAPAAPGVSSAALAKLEKEISSLQSKNKKLEDKGKEKDKRIKGLEMEVEVRMCWGGG